MKRLLLITAVGTFGLAGGNTHANLGDRGSEFGLRLGTRIVVAFQDERNRGALAAAENEVIA
jgi:hypothetical protein